MHRRPGQDSRVEKRNVGNNGGQRHPESKPWTRRSVGRRRRSNACATAANIPIRLATLWRGGNKSRSITVQPSPGSTGSCTHTRCVITFKNQRNSAADSLHVKALRSDRGASRQLLLAALNRQFELLLSVPLILEYEAVMTRPQHLAACGLSSAEVGHVLDDLAAVARPVRLAFRWRPRLSDPDDDMVLETAINGSASAIVTFNLRDFAAGIKGFGCAVILPAMALQQIRSVIP